MKIVGHSGVSKPSDVARKRKVGDSTSGFDNLIHDASESHALSGTVAASPLDALLALQQVSDEEVNRQKDIKHGKDLLDVLDQIRQGLLMGAIPVAQIRRVKELAARQTQQFTDPALRSVLQEIEVRAAVELAKLERYL